MRHKEDVVADRKYGVLGFLHEVRDGIPEIRHLGIQSRKNIGDIQIAHRKDAQCGPAAHNWPQRSGEERFVHTKCHNRSDEQSEWLQVTRSNEMQNTVK